MNQKSKFIVVAAALALAGGLSYSLASRAQDRKEQAATRPPCFVEIMLGPHHDLRSLFYPPLTNLLSAESNGVFILIKGGTIELAETVSTNDCPTVESAARRGGLSRISVQRQVRIIQQNRILQSGHGLDPAEKRQLLELRIESGDIVIISGVE